MDLNAPLSFSRRDLAKIAAVGSLLASFPLKAALFDQRPQSRAVVGFFNDAPWLDPSGRDLAYVPPARVAAHAPDSESLMRQGFFL